MKKAFLLMAVILVIFTGCKKNDDNNGGGINGNVVGKWKLISATLDGGSEQVFSYEYLELKSDKTFVECYAGDRNSAYYAVGTWNQTSGKLQINYDNDLSNELYPSQVPTINVPMSYTITKLDGSTLILKATAMGFEYIATYSKQ